MTLKLHFKIISSIIFCLGFLHSFGQVIGDYRTNAVATIFSTPANWDIYTGTSWVTATNKPTATNTIYVQSGHTLTLSANESCKDLILNTSTAIRLDLVSFTLSVNGSLKATNSGLNVFPVTFTSSLSSGVSWIKSTTGKISIVGNTRLLTSATDWGADNAGTATPNGFDLEIALNPGQTVSLETNIKARSFNVVSGTLNAGIFRMSPDQGTLAGSDFTIQNGATVISAATGTVANAVMARNTNTTSGNGNNLTINTGGLLKLTGAAPTIEMLSYTINGTIEYAAQGNQNFIAKSVINAVNLSDYKNIIISGSGIKTQVLSSMASGIIIVNAGCTIATGGFSFLTTGTANINGTFQIDQNGWGGNTGVFVYGVDGKLVFNNTVGSYGISATDTFWPNTNGPNFVTVQNGGGITLNTNKSIPSTGSVGSFLITNSGITIASGNVLTLNDICQINTGGFFINPPFYGVNATLIYNTGDNYTVAAEWESNATSGIGVPQNVIIGAGAANSAITFGTTTAYRHLNGNLTVSNNAGATMSLSTAFGGDLKVKGNFINNGVFNPNNAAVFFVGNAPQTISGTTATVFDYLLLAQTTASTISLNNDITINKILTFGAGKIVTDLNKVIMTATGSTTGASSTSYIFGKQQYPITSISSKTFDIGDSMVWAPITTDFTAVTASGTLIASTIGADHIDIANANVLPDLSVNRNWTLTPNGLTGTYNSVFNFIISDTDALSNSADYIIARYGTTWSQPTLGVKTTTSTQAIGVSVFGDFQLGEMKAIRWNGSAWSNAVGPNAILECIIAGPYSTAINGGGFTTKKMTIESPSSALLTINTGDSIIIINELLNHLNEDKIIVENGATLVQTDGISNNNEGGLTYKRNTTILNKNYDFVYWGSPVANQTFINMWMTASNDPFYSYNNSASPQNWQAEAATAIMQPGIGYTTRTVSGSGIPVWTPTNSWTANFIGKPNNGNYSLNVFNNGSGGADNLLSNPYPSAIDIIAFRNDTDNKAILTGNFYFWTHSTTLNAANAFSESDYAIYNVTLNASIGTSPTNNPTPPDQYVDAGQGFFAEALTSGVVTFKNAHRVSGNNNNFYKTTAQKAQTVSENQKIWLNLNSADGMFKQQLLTYSNGASNNFDALLDAKSFGENPNFDFYSIASDLNLAIQSRQAPFLNTDQIQLGYKTNSPGNFTITIDHYDELFKNKTIYLYDALTQVDYILSNSSYTFYSNAGSFNTRFVLKYISNQYADPSEQNLIIANSEQTLKIKCLTQNLNRIIIYDMLGKVIYQKEKIDVNEIIITNLMKNQNIILSATLTDGTDIIKKVGL